MKDLTATEMKRNLNSWDSNGDGCHPSLSFPSTFIFSFSSGGKKSIGDIFFF
jgi:hypothetical protein